MHAKCKALIGMQLKRYIFFMQNWQYLGRWLARAFIIPNPFQCLLFRSFGLGILPLSRDDCLGCSNKRSYKKSIINIIGNAWEMQGLNRYAIKTVYIFYAELVISGALVFFFLPGSACTIPFLGCY